MTNGSGKGSARRPCLIGQHEEALRYKLAGGYITFDEYEKRMKKLRKEGKLKKGR